jgi:hypothetical protein
MSSHPNFKASPTLSFDPLPFLGGIYDDAPNIKSNINVRVLLTKQFVNKKNPFPHTLVLA